jgi:hypothetical protein
MRVHALFSVLHDVNHISCDLQALAEFFSLFAQIKFRHIRLRGAQDVMSQSE